MRDQPRSFRPARAGDGIAGMVVEYQVFSSRETKVNGCQMAGRAYAFFALTMFHNERSSDIGLAERSMSWSGLDVDRLEADVQEGGKAVFGRLGGFL